MERKGKRTGVLGKIMAGIASAFHAIARQTKNATPAKPIGTPEHYTARKPRRYKREMKGRFGGGGAQIGNGATGPIFNNNSLEYGGPAHLQRKLDRRAVGKAIEHWKAQRGAAQKIKEGQKRLLEKMMADAVIADAAIRFPAGAAKV